MRTHDLEWSCPVDFVVCSLYPFPAIMLFVSLRKHPLSVKSNSQKSNWIFYNGVALDPNPKPNVLCGERDGSSPVPVDGGERTGRSIGYILGFLRLLPYWRRGETGASSPMVIKGRAI